MYFIHDYNPKELIFGFSTYTEAERYFLINSVVEKLKIYRHSLLTKTLENTDLIPTLRNIEEIMENIITIDDETEPNYILGQLNMAKAFLNNTPLELKYTINLIGEEIRTYKLT